MALSQVGQRGAETLEVLAVRHGVSKSALGRHRLGMRGTGRDEPGAGGGGERREWGGGWDVSRSVPCRRHARARDPRSPDPIDVPPSPTHCALTPTPALLAPDRAETTPVQRALVIADLRSRGRFSRSKRLALAVEWGRHRPCDPGVPPGGDGRPGGGPRAARGAARDEHRLLDREEGRVAQERRPTEQESRGRRRTSRRERRTTACVSRPSRSRPSPAARAVEVYPTAVSGLSQAGRALSQPLSQRAGGLDSRGRGRRRAVHRKDERCSGPAPR